MVDTTGSQEFTALTQDLNLVKQNVNQLAAAVGQDVKNLKNKTLASYTLTGLAAQYPATVILNTDDALTALGKLQAQIATVDGKIPAVDYSEALHEVLTGLTIPATASAVTSQDTILVSFGKLQKQINDVQTLNVTTITNTMNADDLKQNREYFSPSDGVTATARNFPTTIAGHLLVRTISGSSIVIQEYTSSDLKKWVRSFNGTDWTAWKVVLA